ncbi:MAG: hypothetical protein MZV70_45315 [Desulfobacterales bacterium]|nr:hypothetical protein [Desulfobacterales bacterium]
MRRHAYLTVEHLLLRALPRRARRGGAARTAARELKRLKSRARSASSTTRSRREPGDGAVETGQTLAFHRVLQQRARSTPTSAESEEVEAGDLARRALPGARLARRGAAARAGRLAPRRAQVHLARRREAAESRERRRAGRRRAAPGRSGTGEGDEDEVPADPLERLRDEPHRRARSRASSTRWSAASASSSARSTMLCAAAQEQPDLRRRDRRRQDRASPRAWRSASSRARCPTTCAARRSISLDHRRAARRHALPRRLRGALQGASSRRVKERPQPDPVHRRDPHHRSAPAPTTGGDASTPRNLLKPLLAAGELRCIGLDHVRGVPGTSRSDRALARRFQQHRGATSRRSRTTVQILEGLRAALRGAPRRALRRRAPLRRGGGAVGQGTCTTASCPTRPST